MSGPVLEWKVPSRGKVDEVIKRVRMGRRVKGVKTDIACPECRYVIRGNYFPALCIYCGHSL